ncbi:MAG: hypothetical protein H6667_18235 [Ardenticatenaceae bacterium]|nr:hypothetical protein [Ardenticatenaceae bacterium]
MTEQRHCDFCGRPEDELKRFPNRSSKLELEADGLWVCSDCQPRLQSTPISQSDEYLDEAIKALIGQSVGAICYTLNLPYEPPYQVIIDAASLLGYDEDFRYMSAWLFVTQWLDGTTVWQAEDGEQRPLSPRWRVHID